MRSTTTWAVLAAAGSLVAVGFAGASDTDWAVGVVVVGAGVAAVATGVAVDLRLPPLGGAGRRLRSLLGFVSVAALYAVAMGAFLWVVLDSDDDSALVPEFSGALDLIGIGAIAVQVAAGFALGRWSALPVLVAVGLALGRVLTANQEPCQGAFCISDSGAWVGTVVLGVVPLVLLGVFARVWIEKYGAPVGGHVLAGLVAFLVVLGSPAAFAARFAA